MLIVKDFQWSQTDDQIVIQVPLNGPKADADILTHENFVKIYSAPFYFEAFLLNTIIEEESRCILTNTEARFYLKKADAIEWEKLERDFIDKAEKFNFKNEIIEKVQVKAKESLKLKLEQKEKTKRAEVENSIAKDAQVRETIEKLQQRAIDGEMSKVQQVKEPAKKISPRARVQQIKQQQELPPVRTSASIEIQFSKRNFITPKRESQDPAEQEWLLKQTEARREIGFVAEDLRPEERDPMFLKDKGDEFFRQQNFLAAISAYSTGIQIASKCYELHLNRSAAHMALENYQRCAEDCSKALDLLHPPVASNLKARIQALARRGAALSKLGFVRQALGEFVAAVQLDPTDALLTRDAEMLRAKLEAEGNE